MDVIQRAELYLIDYGRFSYRNMKIGAIVQARMTSQRFPGKVLHDIAGKPMLTYLLERLKCCTSLDAIVVATSSDKLDETIYLLCERHDIPCYRGSLTNVAERFMKVLEVNPFDAFVRISGDSPLLDQRLVERGLEMIRNSSNYDVVTNVFPRTYPKGQSVEILRSGTFQAVYPLFREDEDREHVTTYFYKNKEKFKIFNFASETNNGNIQLSVDTPQDMSTVGKIISSMTKPHWEYTLDEILALHHRVTASQ